MLEKTFTLLLASALLGALTAKWALGECLCPCPCATPTPTVFNPALSNSVLKNPGTGFQTTQKPITEVSNPRSIPSTSEVFRFYAHEINPSPGVYTWSVIDNAKAKAHAAGQTLNIRIVFIDPWDGHWLVGTVPGSNVRCTTEGGGTHFAPDFNSSVTQQKHLELITAFANRYNADPDIGIVDIGTVGNYAEWNTYCLVYSGTQTAYPMPSDNAQRTIISHYRQKITKPLVVVLDGLVARQEALTYNLGWRADCWGGPNHEGPGKLYDQWMHNPDMTNVWKTAPVLLECCGSMTSTGSFSIQQKVDQALVKHATLINTKNTFAVPDQQWAEWQRLLTSMGYRYAVDTFTSTPSNGALNITVKWHNAGVAPCYAGYQLAIKVGNFTNTRSACRLPGAYEDVLSFTLPPGVYAAKASITDGAGVPKAALANTGVDASGWLNLGNVVVP